MHKRIICITLIVVLGFTIVPVSGFTVSNSENLETNNIATQEWNGFRNAQTSVVWEQNVNEGTNIFVKDSYVAVQAGTSVELRNKNDGSLLSTHSIPEGEVKGIENDTIFVEESNSVSTVGIDRTTDNINSSYVTVNIARVNETSFALYVTDNWEIIAENLTSNEKVDYGIANLSHYTPANEPPYNILNESITSMGPNNNILLFNDDAYAVLQPGGESDVFRYTSEDTETLVSNNYSTIVDKDYDEGGLVDYNTSTLIESRDQFLWALPDDDKWFSEILGETHTTILSGTNPILSNTTRTVIFNTSHGKKASFNYSSESGTNFQPHNDVENISNEMVFYQTRQDTDSNRKLLKIETNIEASSVTEESEEQEERDIPEELSFENKTKNITNQWFSAYGGVGDRIVDYENIKEHIVIGVESGRIGTHKKGDSWNSQSVFSNDLSNTTGLADTTDMLQIEGYENQNSPSVNHINTHIAYEDSSQSNSPIATTEDIGGNIYNVNSTQSASGIATINFNGKEQLLIEIIGHTNPFGDSPAPPATLLWDSESNSITKINNQTPTPNDNRADRENYAFTVNDQYIYSYTQQETQVIDMDNDESKFLENSIITHNENDIIVGDGNRLKLYDRQTLSNNIMDSDLSEVTPLENISYPSGVNSFDTSFFVGGYWFMTDKATNTFYVYNEELTESEVAINQVDRAIDNPYIFVNDGTIKYFASDSDNPEFLYYYNTEIQVQSGCLDYLYPSDLSELPNAPNVCWIPMFVGVGILNSVYQWFILAMFIAMPIGRETDSDIATMATINGVLLIGMVLGTISPAIVAIGVLGMVLLGVYAMSGTDVKINMDGGGGI